jgi:hypothetical protein
LGAPIFKQADDGRLLAIRNWRHRHGIEDALIAEPLSRAETRHYEKCKDAGASDEEIFDDLFLEAHGERVAIPIYELTKSQLVKLLGQQLGCELATLGRMSRDDLIELLRALRRRSSLAAQNAWVS